MEVKTKESKLASVENKLNNIFMSRFKIDFDMLEAEYRDEHLLSRRIRLAPRDMLYLLCDIESKFVIEIPKEQIANGGFSSFNNIALIISSQLDNRL